MIAFVTKRALESGIKLSVLGRLPAKVIHLPPTILALFPPRPRLSGANAAPDLQYVPEWPLPHDPETPEHQNL